MLMDAGCEYHGYVSDVTRTWPVSGQFTPLQKDLYEVVRATKEEITKVRKLVLSPTYALVCYSCCTLKVCDISPQMCRAGVTLNYLHSAAVEILADELKSMIHKII